MCNGCATKKTLLVSLQVVGGSAWRFQVLGLNLVAVGFFFFGRGGETGFYPLEKKKIGLWGPHN